MCDFQNKRGASTYEGACCIGGYLRNLNIAPGDNVPCPECNADAYIEYCVKRFGEINAAKRNVDPQYWVQRPVKVITDYRALYGDSRLARTLPRNKTLMKGI